MIRAKQKKRPDVATLEMKLSKSYSKSEKGPQTMADLKLGMNCLTRGGIQQNTTCLFQQRFEEHPKKKVKEEPQEKVLKVGDKGYRKPGLDQRNPYVQRKVL